MRFELPELPYAIGDLEPQLANWCFANENLETYTPKDDSRLCV
jgi:hypothetical protein